MKAKAITIKPDGEVDPVMLRMQAGEVVTFQNEARGPALLKFRKRLPFGGTNFRVRVGEALSLQVQQTATPDTYMYEVHVTANGKPRPGSPCIIIDG